MASTPTDLRNLPAEALSTLDELTRDALAINPVLPETYAEQFCQSWSSICETAHSRGIRTVGALLTRQAEVLNEIAGAPALGAHSPTRTREAYHLHRNVLLTAVLAAYLPQPTLPSRQQPKPTALVPALAHRRSAEVDRPATDDEIALARAWALIRARHAQGSFGAAIYAQCDAGVRVGEVAFVTTKHLDDVASPELLLAPGTERRAARYLELDAFHRRAFTARIQYLKPGAEHLTRHPRAATTSEESGRASATTSLVAFIVDLGLEHSDFPPAAIVRWRVKHTWLHQGILAASEVAGTGPQGVDSDLGLSRKLREPAPTAPKGSQAAL